MASYRAVLRYYRGDPHVARYLFRGRLAVPRNGATTPNLALSFAEDSPSYRHKMRKLLI